MGVVEDIIGLKSALDTEWDDIVATQGQVEKLMKDGLTWWKTNEAAMWTDFETAKDDFMADLQALHVGDFEASIDKVADAIKSEIEPILKQIEGLGDDADFSKIIDSILTKFPAFPGLSNPPADMIKLPELNAAAFQSVFDEVLNLEKDFKVAIKPLNPPANEGSGAGTAESKEIATTLFSAFESSLESYLKPPITGLSGELETMKSALEQRVEDDVFSSLQTNVENAINNLKGKTLTADLILEQLKGLMVNELDSMVGVAGEVVNNMKTDLANVRSLLHGLANVKADAESDFAQFFNEVFDKPQPTLLEAVSFVIAIPLTLTSQVTTGQNFYIPQKAFLTFDATTQTWMTGILQVLDIVQALFDKVYHLDMERNHRPISYVYKVIMGVLGTIKSVLYKVAFAPIGKFTPITNIKDNLLWYLDFGTGLGFSTAQWMLDAYLTKENKVADGAKDLQDQVNTLYYDYHDIVTNQSDAYTALKTRYKKYITDDISKYDTLIQSTRNSLKSLMNGINPIPDSVAGYQSYLNTIKHATYLYQNIAAEALKINSYMSTIVNKRLEAKRKSASTKTANNLKILKDASDDFIAFNKNFTALQHFAESQEGATVKPILDNTAGNKFLNGVCPAIDLGITLSTLGFKILFYNIKKGQDESTLVKAIVSSSISAVSDAVSLYFYNNPPEKGSTSENVQTGVTNLLFLGSNGWKGYLAYGNLDMVTRLNNLEYDSTVPSLKVSFNLDVTAVGTLGPDSFVLDSQTAGAGIHKVTLEDESDYIIKLSDSLSIGTHSLAVAQSQFKDPRGNQVVTSIAFTVPHGIESANYDASTKVITVTLESSLDLKVAEDKCFTLSSSTAKEIPITIAGSGTTYTLTAKTTPFPSGKYHARTGTGAFQDSSGKGVVSVCGFEIPNPTT